MTSSIRSVMHRLDQLEVSASKKLTEQQKKELDLARTLFGSKHNLEFQKKLACAEYRHKGGRLNSPDSELLSKLTAAAAAWKKRQLPFKDKNLSDADDLKLRQLACYPKYLRLLLRDKHHLSAFFKWSLLNHLSVAIFVEFPLVTHKIDKSLLKSRIGAFGGTALVLHDKGEAKDVTLAMEGRPVSILDGTRSVTLSRNLVMTVDQIFQVFKKKNFEEGHLTFFKDEGVCNWDPHRLGPLNGLTGEIEEIDLCQEHWWRKLRMKEHLTQEEATKRFGFPCDGKIWVKTVVATRLTKHLDMTGAHSFIRYAIPREDGSYDLTYGWGKFAKKYPQGGCDSLGYLMKPCQGTLEYPENNETYTSREHLEKHFPMTPEKGAESLESIRRDLLKVRMNNFPFQILTHHCTEWVVKKVRKYVGVKESQMFDIPIFEIKARGFFGALIRILAKTPQWFRDIVLFLFGCVMGGLRKLHLISKSGAKKTICVLKTPPWSSGSVFRHPGIAFIKQT